MRLIGSDGAGAMSDAFKPPRRNFLRVAGIGAVAAAVPPTLGSDPATAAEVVNPYSGPLPRRWDADFDFIVVGGGGSGLCGAIEAAQSGVKLLVIEKMPFIGGISAMATGNFYGGDTVLQKQQGIKDATREIWWEMMEAGTALSEPLNRVRDNSMLSPVYYGITKRCPQLLKDISWEYYTLIDFLLKYGAKFMPMQQDYPFTHTVIRGYLPVVFQNVADDIRKHGGKIVTDTRADKIYLDEKGKVAGLRAVNGSGKSVNVKTRAVLMASGGFVNNDALIMRYMPYWATKGKVATAFLYSEGGLFLNQETGDGIIMGLDINASLDDMIAGFKYKIAPKNRGDAVVNGLALARSPIIFVTPQGKRVDDDSKDYSEVTLALIRAGAKYGFFVFDQSAMSTDGAKRFGFQELVDSGTIFKANTLREAATKAGVDPDGLQATVDQFNKDFDEKGYDTVFGKKGPLFQKIITPPFYVSAPHYPVRFKTEGGLETDERTRVLDHRTVKPIIGFYAAGATSGTCSSRLGDSMQCGRLAARYIVEDLKARHL